MKKPIDWQDAEHLKLVEGWLEHATHNTPATLSWAVFVGRLQRAAEEFRQVENSDAARLDLISRVATVFSEFMSREPAFSDPQVRGSLVPLLAAIGDVAQGRRPSMFDPPPAPNRPPMSIAEANTAGASARALTELMKAGDAHIPSSMKVNLAVQKGLCAGYKICEAGTIRNWRNKIHKGEDFISKYAIKRYHAKLPDHVGPTSRNRAEFLLEVLAYGVTFR